MRFEYSRLYFHNSKLSRENIVLRKTRTIGIVGFAQRGKWLYVVLLKAGLHKYLTDIHSTLIFQHTGPLDGLEKRGNYRNTLPKLRTFRIECVTNSDLSFFARLDSHFSGYASGYVHC